MILFQHPRQWGKPASIQNGFAPMNNVTGSWQYMDWYFQLRMAMKSKLRHQFAVLKNVAAAVLLSSVSANTMRNANRVRNQSDRWGALIKMLIINLQISQKTLLARNDAMQWVHAGCLHNESKSVCMRCQEPILEANDGIEGFMGSKVGLYHTWCNAKKQRK